MQCVGGRAGEQKLNVSKLRTTLRKGPMDRGGGFNCRVPWERQKISEIQTRKHRKEGDIGDLGTESQD